MSKAGSLESQNQTYLPIEQLQRYFLCTVLLSISIGLNIGMVIGNPSRLMILLGGLGVAISGLLMFYTGARYSEIDAAVHGREEDEPTYWRKLVYGA